MHALPLPLTALVGREAEVEALERLLRQPARLITVVGPPGVGKTHLALHVAGRAASAFAEGAAFVPLAAIREPDLILPAIAAALGRLPSEAALASYLADRQLLLLLDNFEQASAAAPALADLLSRCPDLKLLVTSREALRVRGEHELPLAPLPPEAAVALFGLRAQALQPDFVLDAATTPLVTEIVRRLDGLPLAIELAAARIKLLPLAALRERLDHRLDALSRGPRDLPARHQTLRAAIAWSYDLLPPGEQRLLRRLGVFAGGCTLEAASQVAPLEVEAGVEALVAKSLLRRAAGAALRLLMLETVRDYALEQLAASGEAPAIHRAHAAYFRGLAEFAEAHLHGGGLRVPSDIGEGLLEQAEERRGAIGVEGEAVEPVHQPALQPGDARNLLELPLNGDVQAKVIQDGGPQLGGDAAHGLHRVIHGAEQLVHPRQGGFGLVGADARAQSLELHLQPG